MVLARLAVAFMLASCGGSGGAGTQVAHPEEPASPHATFHDDDAALPYDEAVLDLAIAAEDQAITAAGEDADPVRGRFLASLQRCKADHRDCPPRLDEPKWSYDVEASSPPKLDTQLRFDLDDWRKVAAELYGRACACRTLDCVDSLGVAIDVLEARPMPDVANDEVAVASITNARECLFRLRGRTRP